MPFTQDQSDPIASRAGHIQPRIASLDVFRGFAVTILLVASPLVSALKEAPPSVARDLVIQQFSHAKGSSVSFFDIGWPAFLTVAGISLHFHLMRQADRGETKLQMFVELLRKCLLCAALAFFIHGGFAIPFSKIYFADVLFVYASVLLIAGTFEIFLGVRGVATLLFMLLAGYSISTTWGTYYVFGSIEQKPGANLDDYMQKLLGSKLAMKYAWYLPRQSMSCLAGLLLARLFQSGSQPQQRVWQLLGIGILAISAGCTLGIWIEINKRLWTTSYTLFAFGITCLFIAIFYQLIDAWHLNGFKMPWIVFGLNSLAAYVCHEIVPFDRYAQIAVGYLFEPWLGQYNGVLLVGVQFALCWWLFYMLYRRGVFIRLG